MRLTRVHPSPGLVEALNDRLGFVIGDTRIYIADVSGELNGEPSIAGFAAGEHVVLLHSLCGEPRLDLETLAHELCHVQQYRDGRAPRRHESDSRLRGGFFAGYDPTLEEEADRWGEVFSQGSCPDRQEPPAKVVEGPRRHTPRPAEQDRCIAVQYKIRIGYEEILGVDALTPHVQNVLALIDGGFAWTEWASRQSEPSHFFFANDADFLNGVQFGLHEQSLLVLPKSAAVVVPSKLLELDPKDLIALDNFELVAGDDRDLSKIQEMLASYGVLPIDALTQARSFLEDLGIAENPIFGTLGLAELIALQRLLIEPATTLGKVRQDREDAAQFALLYARSPRAFVEYYEAFLCFAVIYGKKTPVADRDRADRLAGARYAIEGIRREARAHLSCPRLQSPPIPQGVFGVVNNWLFEGRMLGLDSIASAVRQALFFAMDSGIREPEGSTLERYLDRAGRFLAETVPQPSSLSQDGKSRMFLAEAIGNKGEQAAMLVVDEHGSIALRGYRDITVRQSPSNRTKKESQQ